MTDKVCSVEGCDTASRRAGLCGKHHSRLLRTGHTAETRRWRESPKKCEVDRCDAPPPYKRGWCSKHYSRFQRHGSASSDVVRERSKVKTPCTIDGCASLSVTRRMCQKHYDAARYAEPGPDCSMKECDKKATQRGLCSMHYSRWRLHGDVAHERKLGRGLCTVDGCAKNLVARGFCGLHYDRWKRHGDPTIVLRAVAATACAVEGCNGGAPIVQGHCPAHYRKLRLYGDPTIDRRLVANDECPKCGLTRRRRRTRPFHMECRPCINAERRRRWAEDEEYRLARLEASRRHYQGNRESFAESNRKYHLENRDAVRAASRRWSEANRERLNAQARERYRLNPDAARASRHRYEAAKRDVVCEHGLSCVTESFLSELRWQPCVYCGDYANEADHVVPLSRGGLHCVDNLAPACRRCNTSKNASTPEEWAERLRREAESDR